MGATTQLPTECARGPTHPFESTADAAQAERRAYPSPDRAPAAEALETVTCGGLSYLPKLGPSAAARLSPPPPPALTHHGQRCPPSRTS